MGVDLRGVELLVTENFFEHANVYVAGLIHQCCGGVAEFMYRIMFGFQSCKLEILVNHCLHGLYAHSLIQTAQKDRFCVNVRVFLAYARSKIIGQCRLTSIVEVNDALLATFTHNAQGGQVGVDVADVNSDKFRKTHSAVEEERQNGIVAFAKFGFLIIVNRRQKAQ